MDKTSTDNGNNNETKPSMSKPVETVEDKKKPKRKFEWTPKRKAAFEKCVADTIIVGERRAGALDHLQ